MSKRFALFFIIPLIIGSLLSSSLFAKSLLKHKGDKEMMIFCRSVSADVKVTGQFTSTKLTLVYQHTSLWNREVEFDYELPNGAVATGFSYWAGAEKVVARIVEKKRARAIYNRITTVRRDPALVEMVSKNKFSAKISPIEPFTDLKIELTYVQVLPSNTSGVSYTLPLDGVCEQADDLESIDVNVLVNADQSVSGVANNYGLPVSRSGSAYSIKLSGQNYRSTKDLTVALKRKPAKLHASLISTPASKGNGGFFALALTPEHSFTNPKASITGVSVYEMVLPQVRRVKAGESILVCGRYRGSGKAEVTLSGKSDLGQMKSAAVVEFGRDTSSGNIATKLWAAGRIADLGRKAANRSKVIKMSMQYTLPSRFTSWLAVPKEVMARYKWELAEEHLYEVSDCLSNAILKGNLPASEIQRLLRKQKQLCSEVGYNPVENLHCALESSMDELVKMMSEGKENRSQARALKTRISQVLKGRFPESYKDAVKNEAESIRDKIFAETYNVKPDRKLIDKLTKNLERLHVSARLKEHYYQDELDSCLFSFEDEIARLVEEGAPDTEISEVRKRYEVVLSRFGCKNTRKQTGAGEYRLDKLVDEWLTEKYSTTSHPARLKQLSDKIERLEKKYKLSRNNGISEREEYLLWNQFDEYLNLVADGKVNTPAAKKLKACLSVWWKKDTQTVDEHIIEIAKQRMSYAAQSYVYELGNTPRDSKDVLYYQQRLQSLASLAGESVDEYIRIAEQEKSAEEINSKAERDAEVLSAKFLIEAQKDRPQITNLEQTRKQLFSLNQMYLDDKDYALSFDEKLGKAISIINSQNETHEAADQKELATLRAGKRLLVGSLREEHEYLLHKFRHGDPLISVQAKADAVRVVALMPDGEIKELVYNPANKHWEGRFDVPLYAAEGNYSISVIAVNKDGSREVTTLNYGVDTTAPLGSGSVSASSSRALVQLDASEDTVRVVALLPWGERIELMRTDVANRFCSIVTLPEEYRAKGYVVTFVLTDAAHNRTSITVDSSK